MFEKPELCRFSAFDCVFRHTGDGCKKFVQTGFTNGSTSLAMIITQLYTERRHEERFDHDIHIIIVNKTKEARHRGG